MELVCPAGTPGALRAAVAAGADAVYSEPFLIEANDASCLRHLAGRPHAIGPFINTYNEATAAFLAARGATRFCLPPELPTPSMAVIAHSAPHVLFETLAFGRLPLAISARCYHARLHKLAKDNCRFVCESDPDGLAVDTLDGQRFLAINGVQTLSFTCANLVADIPALSAAGLRALRLSPQVCDMAAVARVFRDVLDGRREAGSGLEALGAIYPKATFANGFLHGEAGARWIGPARPA